MNEELERIRAKVWEAMQQATPRDAAPLARILIDLERGTDQPQQVESTLTDLEERRKRRAAGA